LHHDDAPPRLRGTTPKGADGPRDA
jgi:hypothetical protein